MSTGKEPDVVQLHIRLPKDLKEEVERLAKRDRRSVAAQIQVLVEKGVGLDARGERRQAA